MARECGWTKDYIADNLTVEQITKYCDIIQKQKLREAQLNGIVMLQAVATAFGSLKYADFKKFLDSLSMKKQDINKALDEAKKAGLPIEEH